MSKGWNSLLSLKSTDPLSIWFIDWCSSFNFLDLEFGTTIYLTTIKWIDWLVTCIVTASIVRGEQTTLLGILSLQHTCTLDSWHYKKSTAFMKNKRMSDHFVKPYTCLVQWYVKCWISNIIIGPLVNNLSLTAYSTTTVQIADQYTQIEQLCNFNMFQ